MATSKFNPSPKKPLTKYYRSASGTSPFLKKPPKINWKSRALKLGDIVLLLALAGGLIYSLIVNPSPKVVVNNQDYHSAAAYQSAAAGLMGGLKNHSKLTFDGAFVSQKLQAKFPEIARVYVELPLISQRPVVHLNISPPEVLLQSEGKIYVVDGQGVVTGLSAQSAASQKLPLIIDQSSFKVNIAKAVLSQPSIAFVNQLIEQCRLAKVPIDQMILPNAAQELDLKTKDQPYITKFYLGGDASRQIGQFLATRHKFIVSGPPPTNYLDVRVPGKVFYR
jgi:hypothetical protein